MGYYYLGVCTELFVYDHEKCLLLQQPAIKITSINEMQNYLSLLINIVKKNHKTFFFYQ